MRCLTICRALLVRILFSIHGMIAIWRLYMVIGQIWCWYLSAALLGLFIETIVTLVKKRGKEWKWFCPSVFFYLASVVPAIWFLELHNMHKRIDKRNNFNASLPVIQDANSTDEDLTVDIKGIGKITIPFAIPSDLWLKVIEQFLLLMLIIGRWLLPKGALSHDQLSQLLLVYVGTAADIVEFFEAFNEDKVKFNPMLCYIVLGIWTSSLMQFTLVLTATRARRDHAGAPNAIQLHDPDSACCNPEIYGILISIFMQDCPFLVVRLLLIFKYQVVSYTNMFFTSKNSLVIILLLYRVVVVHCETHNKKRNVKGSPMVPRCRPVDGFVEYETKNGRVNLKPCQSTPDVYVCKTNDSLQRYKTLKRIGKSDPQMIKSKSK
ncbi:transmembrane protein 26-like [Mytilus edulis]|uniref:transmembrane protein 26-like n=1 Tax=Mytilus trossulus TaxID=6551 RepID=UPI0030058274